MFCLASRYQASPENLDQVAQIFKEQAVPAVSRQTGFKGVYLMTKPGGEFMVLNIWDTEEQANAWPQNSQHQEIVAQLKPLLGGPPVRDGYEVRAHAVA
jgi:heme-degrading monooxygenase HmoA